MYISNIKAIMRSLYRHKGYAAINIIGLSVGLACSLIIMLFIAEELGYDVCHEKADRIYRVLTFNEQFNSQTPSTSFLLAPVVTEQFPEFESVARVGFIPCKIKDNDNWQRGGLFWGADKDIFNIFTLPLINGNPENALERPASVVLSKRKAQLLFPGDDPIGKTITIETRGEQIHLTVTGIMNNWQLKSSFRADFLASIDVFQLYLKSHFSIYGTFYEDNWDRKFYSTYILRGENTNIDYISSTFPQRLKNHNKEAEKGIYSLQELSDFYLNSSHIINHHLPAGNLQNIYIFAAVAFLILILAGANYSILSMARSLTRTKEFGVRKVIGASTGSIVRQVIGESLLTIIISLPLAIVLIEILLPIVNQMFRTSLENNFYSDWSFWVGTFLITIFIGIASSIYQAFVVSKLDPIAIFNNNFTMGGGKSIFRRIIVTAQLVVFVALTAGSVVIYKQIDYSVSGDVGFNRQNALAAHISYQDIQEKYAIIKNELAKISGIVGISGASSLPPNDGSAIMSFRTVYDSSVTKNVERISIDYDFASTLGLTLIEGRDFSRDLDAPGTKSVILNETAVRVLGIENPIGKSLQAYNIIGVVKDFHQHSFRKEIKPMMFDLNPKSASNVLVRINSENKAETVAAINEAWHELYPSATGEFHYLSDYFEDIYSEERNFGEIILYFTLLAISIASLGLFGLSSFMSKRRTKEIGIRKVFGASVSKIIVMLVKEFILLVILASVISLPIVNYTMSHWLDNYVYRIDIGVQPVIFGLILGILITCIAAGYHSLKAATANPIDAIKYE